MEPVHTIIDHHNPDRNTVGGIDGFIRDMVRLGGGRRHFRIIGVTHPGSHRQLGRWSQVDLPCGRSADFMPVATIATQPHRRLIPHSVVFLRGLLKYQPKVGRTIVHFHRAETAAAWTSRVPEARRAVFIHGPGRAALAHRVESFWRFAPFAYDVALNRALNHADFAYVMHGGLAEALKVRYPTVRHGANWYDTAHFYPPEPPSVARPPVIAWAGRFEPAKDPVLAVRVFAALANHGIEFRAWMGGDGSLLPVVQQELRAHDLDSVDLPGSLRPSDLGARLRFSSVFLLTSRFEGIPRSVVEALACGVPVVSPRVGDVSDLIQRGCGITVEDRTPAALSAAIADVLQTKARHAIAASVSHLEARIVLDRLLEDLEA